jgi:hypothetical protein
MNDFDFLHGKWDVANHRLVTPLAGGGDWEDFPATCTCRALLGGPANLDEMSFPTRGFHAITLRLFDPARAEWSIYWASSRDGLLQPPVSGRFSDGVGVFLGDDTFAGTAIRVRFVWSDLTADTASWEQSFSTDGEATWETNWTMTFTRRHRSAGTPR